MIRPSKHSKTTSFAIRHSVLIVGLTYSLAHACRLAAKPSTRSIGVNAVAPREQEPDPVPPWESPTFLPPSFSGTSLWQELCVSAGDSVTALLSADAAGGFNAMLSSSATAVPDGLLSNVQAKVKICLDFHIALPLEGFILTII